MPRHSSKRRICVHYYETIRPPKIDIEIDASPQIAARNSFVSIRKRDTCDHNHGSTRRSAQESRFPTHEEAEQLAIPQVPLPEWARTPMGKSASDLRCWRFLQRCREFRHTAGGIPCMSLNPLDGVWIALQRMAVAFIGKEVIRYGSRELDVLAEHDQLRAGHGHSSGAGRRV